MISELASEMTTRNKLNMRKISYSHDVCIQPPKHCYPLEQQSIFHNVV